MDERDFRIQLEGRAERVEAALERYRALEKSLRGLRWKSKLLAQRDLLLEAAAAADDVLAAIAVVKKRAPSGPSRVVQRAGEVAELDAKLRALCVRRLKTEDQPLSTALRALEKHVASAPRTVLPNENLETARLLLPRTDADVKRVEALFKKVAALFKSKVSPSKAIPFSVPALEEVAAEWPRGLDAVDRLWERLSKADRAGGMTRFLRRQARRAPSTAPADGAQVLVHAEYWKRVALEQLEVLVSSRLSPLGAPEGLLWHVAVWLARHQSDGSARLAVVPGLPRPRAALYELAHALGASRDWGELGPLALEAESLPPGDPEVALLRENLRVLVRVVAQADHRKPLERSLEPRRIPTSRGPEPQTLSAMVAALRDRT